MYERRTFIESDFPAATSDFWDDKAAELWNQYKYFEEASLDLRSNIWPECARAYLCRFDLPENEGLDWATGSDLHETDIWDAVNYHTDAILNSIMPRDGNYMELISLLEEDQGILNDVRDLMMSIHRRADTRGQYGKHIKQLLIYGTSALWWRWESIEKWQGFGPAETARRLEEEGIILTPDELKKRFKKMKFLVKQFSGPVVRTINMYDFFMDPAADLAAERDVPIVTRFYLTEQDLKAARDENGEQKFQNLEGVEPLTLEQIYNRDGDERLELLNELGLSPSANEGTHSRGGRFVPVYLFHQPVREFEDGSVYEDCFFYVAEGGKNGQQLIRVEQNPHRNGSRGIYIDTYIDAWSGTSYGIGAVEKSLKAWQEKNVVSALGLSAALSSVFPAYTVVGGFLQDDNEIKVAPGSFNLITPKHGLPDPHAFIQPLPVPTQGVGIGQQVEQWLGQKILGQFGSFGAIMQDPTKSVSQGKTATQINVESTTGSVMRDNLIEKLSIRSLEPLMQDIYDAARQYLDDETLQFDKIQDGGVKVGLLSRDELDIDRRVLCTGYHGLVNKAREIEELQNVIQILTTGNAMEVNPNLRAVLQEAVFKLLGRLGMKNLDQYKQEPIQLILQDPQIQMQIMQLAMQGPEQIMMMMQQMQGGQPQADPRSRAVEYGQPASPEPLPNQTGITGSEISIQ